jgi:hypothetical protein
MMESSDEEEGEASGVGQELVTQGEGEGDVSQFDAAAAAAAVPPQTDSLQRRVDSTESATAASAAASDAAADAAASALASSSHDTTPPADFRLKGRVPLRRASHFRLERPQEDGEHEALMQEGAGEVGGAPKLSKDSQVHCDVPHYTCDV